MMLIEQATENVKTKIVKRGKQELGRVSSVQNDVRSAWVTGSMRMLPIACFAFVWWENKTKEKKLDSQGKKTFFPLKFRRISCQLELSRKSRLNAHTRARRSHCPARVWTHRRRSMCQAPPVENMVSATAGGDLTSGIA
jgi:hypothetical protein